MFVSNLPYFNIKDCKNKVFNIDYGINSSPSPGRGPSARLLGRIAGIRRSQRDPETADEIARHASEIRTGRSEPLLEPRIGVSRVIAANTALLYNAWYRWGYARRRFAGHPTGAGKDRNDDFQSLPRFLAAAWLAARQALRAHSLARTG